MLVTGSLTTILLVIFAVFWFRKEIKAATNRSARVLDIATQATERNVATLANENLVEIIDRQIAVANKLGVSYKTDDGKIMEPYDFYKSLMK